MGGPVVKEALYDPQTMRRFACIDLGRESAPDETMVRRFRHLLETHSLAQTLFDAVSAHLEDCGITLSQGAIVDATIIAELSSTKNGDKARAPEMHQMTKGKQWYLGMRAHIGVDGASGLAYHVKSTAANVAT